MKSDLLPLKIIPNAKQDQIVGRFEDSIKIKLRAPATDGKANAALIQLIAAKLKLPKSKISIASGELSRHKLLAVEGLSRSEIEELIMK